MLRVYEPPTTSVSKISLASESAMGGSPFRPVDHGSRDIETYIRCHDSRHGKQHVSFLLVKSALLATILAGKGFMLGWSTSLVDFGGNLTIYIV